MENQDPDPSSHGVRPGERAGDVRMKKEFLTTKGIERLNNKKLNRELERRGITYNEGSNRTHRRNLLKADVKREMANEALMTESSTTTQSSTNAIPSSNMTATEPVSEGLLTPPNSLVRKLSSMQIAKGIKRGLGKLQIKKKPSVEGTRASVLLEPDQEQPANRMIGRVGELIGDRIHWSKFEDLSDILKAFKITEIQFHAFHIHPIDRQAAPDEVVRDARRFAQKIIEDLPVQEGEGVEGSVLLANDEAMMNRNKFTTMMDAIKDLQVSMWELKEDNKGFKESNKQQEASIVGLEATVVELTEDNKGLKEANEERDARILDLTEDNKGLKESNKQHQASIVGLKATVVDLKASEVSLKDAVAGLKARISWTDEDLDAVKVERLAFKMELEKLKEAGKWNQSVRNRFIETTRRDRLGRTDINTKIIGTGNMLVHNGDALADAALWKDGIRQDAWTYKAIYGYTWQEVLEFQDSRPIISMISARGTVIANVLHPHDSIHPIAKLDGLIQTCLTGYKALANDTTQQQYLFVRGGSLRPTVGDIDKELAYFNCDKIEKVCGD